MDVYRMPQVLGQPCAVVQVLLASNLSRSRSLALSLFLALSRSRSLSLSLSLSRALSLSLSLACSLALSHSQTPATVRRSGTRMTVVARARPPKRYPNDPRTLTRKTVMPKAVGLFTSLPVCVCMRMQVYIYM